MGIWDVRNGFKGMMGFILMTLFYHLVAGVLHTAKADTERASALISGEVTEYGYYRAEQEAERVFNEHSPSGYERTGGEVVLAKQTQQIPLVQDLLFGFKFHITGFPRDQVVAQLTLKVSHPQMVRPDGSKRSSYSYPIPMNIWKGEINEKTGYKFDKHFEMVPGEWRFEYWYKDALLVSQSFTTVKADAELLQEVKTVLQGPVTPAAASSHTQSTAQSAPAVQSQPQPQPQPQTSASQAAQPVTQSPVAAPKTESAASGQAAATQASTALKQQAGDKTPATSAEKKAVSDKLKPAFQKQIQDIMEQYKAMNYGDRLIPDTPKTTSDNGPVTEMQTGAGQQATETAQQQTPQGNATGVTNNAAAKPDNTSAQPSSAPEGVAQTQ